ALVIAEMVLRATMRRSVATRTHRYMMSDPVLHHRARAGVSVSVSGIPFSTNSLGLRDREYVSPKPASVVRFLMLGDSFTEGAGLGLEQTVAKRVESALDAGGCGAYEVVNAGVASYSPILEYLLLRRLLPALQPDVVALNFDMTDVHDDVVRTATATFDARGLPVAVPSDPLRETAVLLPPPPRWLGPVGPALNGSALYQAFRKSTAAQGLLGPVKVSPEQLQAYGLVGDPERDPMAITRDADLPGLERAWALTERYLLGIRDLARSAGAGFVLVVYPHAHQVSADESPLGRRKLGAGAGLYVSERPFARLEALGRREGFPVVNLLARFRAARAGGPLFRRDDIHHTPAGAAVFADGILTGLRSTGMLAPCGK
ncbi:MAG: SGNH/GDSL hydrolase family protein, partial [Gammaproteobacteria bacterium]